MMFQMQKVEMWLRMTLFTLLVACIALAEQAPMAVYRGPAGKSAAKQLKAQPLGIGIERQRPRPFPLSPLSLGENRRTSTRPLPQAGVRRGVPRQAFQNATVVSLRDGRRLWRMAIASPGAAGLRVHFRRFSVPDGQVTVYTLPDKNGDAVVEGPFVREGPFSDGEFWTGILPGDRATIEYVDSNAAQPPFEVDSVVHLWNAALSPEQNLTVPAAESAGQAKQVAACHLDVSCYESYQTAAKGVVRLSFIGDDGGAYVCSGSMINTINSSFTPYLLTAHHCIGSETEARSLTVRFFYQTSSCGGTPPSHLSVPSVTGARYLAGASYTDGDYSLVQLSQNAPEGTTFLGWTTDAPDIGGSVVGIHHPSGSWKRISFGSRSVDRSGSIEGNIAPANRYYRATWTEGKTEGGSSGSPLLNVQGQIIGTLTYGPSVPDGMTVCDIDPETSGYGRFSNAYAAIRPYLDETPPPTLSVDPASITFVADDGHYESDSEQTLTIRTSSTDPIPYTLATAASWIKLSNSSGTVSAAAPATVSVSIDLPFFSSSVNATGTLTVSSGTLTPAKTTVRAYVTITKANVVATVTPNPVYQATTSADGNPWSYTLRLSETGGVAAKVTSLKLRGVDYTANIKDWFGSDVIPAQGTVSYTLREASVDAPQTGLVEAAGVDTETGAAWSTQLAVSFRPPPTKAALTLESHPATVRRDPSSTGCPWRQYLVLQETGGVGVNLSRFVAAGYDVSDSIAAYWGATKLGPDGSLTGSLCWTSSIMPPTVDFEIGGVDANGAAVSATLRANFAAPVDGAPAMSVSPGSVALSAEEETPAPDSYGVVLSLGSSSASWSARVVSDQAADTWLSVSPLSGTGPAILRVSAVPAGLAAGTYQATLLVESTDAVPQVVRVPISFTVYPPYVETPYIFSVVNAASYQANKVAPGEIVTAYGFDFGTTELAQLQYVNGVAATTLSNTRIYFDDVAAPLIYVQKGIFSQLSCVVPYSVKTSTEVRIEYNGVKSDPITVPVADAVPGIFSLDQSGTGPGAILNWPDYTLNSSSNRVAAGGYVMAFGTGEGKTDIAIDGQKVPQGGPYPKPLLGPWTATIGGKTAAVVYAGAAPDNIAGLFQVNIAVPADLAAGVYDLVISAGEFKSQSGLTVAVK